MRRVQTSEFPALSIYYTPTELGVGPQRNESCAAISVTCNRTRDWLAWTIGLRYLVVSCPDPFRKIEKGSGHETSVCQFVNIRYPIKGACRVTVWAIVGAMPYILWGNCPHCPPPPSSTAYGLQVAISEHTQLPQGLQTFWGPHVIFTLFIPF